VRSQPQRKPLTPELVELFKKNKLENRRVRQAGATTRRPSSPIEQRVAVEERPHPQTPKTICIESAETRQMEQFDQLGSSGNAGAVLGRGGLRRRPSLRRRRMCTDEKGKTGGLIFRTKVPVF